MKKHTSIVVRVVGGYRFNPFNRLAVIALATNALYLVWLALNVHGSLGVLFFFLECLVSLVLVVFTFNHWTRSYQLLGGDYSMRASVDVFIPTVDEPLSMLRKTVEAAVNIDYARKTVYVLDDGARESVRKLAEAYGCTYLARTKTPDKKYKAANLNHALEHSNGDFVLTIDADNIVAPTILDDLMGHFSNDKIAIVASRQVFTVEKDDFNHDHLFYLYMQSGKNSDGAAISCGSGVVYRRAALNDIGGFSEWNLVEDLHTTYVMNSRGYRSVYVSQAYVRGHAPTDVSMIYKQRGTWALDTLRIFFWQHPLLRKGLSFRQRLHYFEMGYCYLVSGIILPAIYIINFYVLFSAAPMLSGGWWYVAFRLPALIGMLAFFGRFSQGQLTSRVWFGLFPVYARATVLALLHRRTKPVYRVTSKIDTGRREVHLLIPQMTFMVIGYSSLVFHLAHYGATRMFWFGSFWTVLMSYWLWPIVKMGFAPKTPKPEFAAEPQIVTG